MDYFSQGSILFFDDEKQDGIVPSAAGETEDSLLPDDGLEVPRYPRINLEDDARSPFGADTICYPYEERDDEPVSSDVAPVSFLGRVEIYNPNGSKIIRCCNGFCGGLPGTKCDTPPGRCANRFRSVEDAKGGDCLMVRQSLGRAPFGSDIVEHVNRRNNTLTVMIVSVSKETSRN